MIRVELPDVGDHRQTLSMNARVHHMVKAKAVKEVRAAVEAAVREQHPGVTIEGRVVVTLVLTPDTRRRQDPDGIAGYLKPCLDGAVDAGLLEDDSSTHVAGVMLVVNRDPSPDKKRHWTLVITPA